MIETQPPETSSPAGIRLQVHEIYLSVQGESTWAGLPCTFVRLTGCPLRCSWCDTEYAFYGGQKLDIEQVLERVRELACPLVEVTGGEPLAQPNCILLLRTLVERGYTVLLETSGACSLASVPEAVHKIMDLKCPDSGEAHRNVWSNIDLLAPHDEVKFVLASRRDYDWARQQVEKYCLVERCAAVLFSCVFGRLEPAQLVEWMTADRLFGIRMQLQIHKMIWAPDARGV